MVTQLDSEEAQVGTKREAFLVYGRVKACPGEAGPFYTRPGCAGLLSPLLHPTQCGQGESLLTVQ